VRGPSGRRSVCHSERTAPLCDHVLVFTGKLGMSRAEAASLASKLGAQVASSVGKDTTHLVVGDQDLRRLAGHVKSSKHRKAEALIAAGHDIQIVQETDFLEWVRCS
jgi:DNA polymerase III subunit epsilon